MRRKQKIIGWVASQSSSSSILHWPSHGIWHITLQRKPHTFKYTQYSHFLPHFVTSFLWFCVLCVCLSLFPFIYTSLQCCMGKFQEAQEYSSSINYDSKREQPEIFECLSYKVSVTIKPESSGWHFKAYWDRELSPVGTYKHNILIFRTDPSRTWIFLVKKGKQLMINIATEKTQYNTK